MGARRISGPKTVLLNRDSAGFTLLELTVVVVVIGILFLFAYQKYLALLVDVERANVEQTVGILRSALGMKVAALIVNGKTSELENYAGTNPIDLLAEVPTNYKGEGTDVEFSGGGRGYWFFNPRRGLLIYKVKNAAEFTNEQTEDAQIRYRLIAVYDNESGRIAGLSLRSIEHYSWFKRPSAR